MLNNSQLTQAIDETKGVIGNNIYIFVPPDRKYFLGELALTAAATLVLRAFFRGFASGAEDKIEEWGREESNTDPVH